MTDDLNAVLNEALPRWAKLTGTKLGSKSFSFTIGSDSEFQDHDLKKYVDDLNESRTLDLTGFTTILLLRGLFEAYVKEKSFSVHTLLYTHAKVEPVLEDLRSFHALISQPCCEEAVTSCKDTLRAAATHYSYAINKIAKQDERAIGDLRLAASRSLDELATHQFTQGARDPRPLQYNRQIFEFSSINSFVHALRHQMISGVTLALIRPEDDVYKAYFVLGLRNGETTTILTDFQEGAHPEYHNMTRRPDRRLDERARQHWFPYRLLKEAAIKHRHKRNKAALVPLDAKAVPIEEVANLEPSEFIWLTLLFDLIAAKFDRDDHKTPELSYTGEMVVSPHALVAATSAIVVAGQYKPLVLPRLTVKTATPELAGNERPLGHNAWLEDRYASRVPEVLLDVVGNRMALDVGKQVSKLLPGKIKDADLPALRKQPNVIRWGGSDRRLEPLVPQALDPSYFGTAKDVEKTRAWYARANLIKGVQRLATVEFAAKRATITSWYRKRVERNMAFIWRAVARGELIAPTTAWKSHEEHGFPAEDELRWKEGNILHQKQAPKYNPFHPRDGVKFGGWDHDRHHNVCAIDPPTRANVFTSIEPDNPRALALLMGLSEKKLPWPLQHWTTREPYTGNCILDRVDPQDSRLDDPWRHLDLSVSIALSKRAYNRLRKEHGLSPAAVAAVEKERD